MKSELVTLKVSLKNVMQFYRDKALRKDATFVGWYVDPTKDAAIFELLVTEEEEKK